MAGAVLCEISHPRKYLERRLSTSLTLLPKVVLSQYGHWDYFYSAEHFTVQRQMVILDISGDIRFEYSALHHFPRHHHLTLYPLPENLLPHGNSSHTVPFSRNFSHGACYNY